MPIIPSQIPPPTNRNNRTRPDYDEIRHTLKVVYPRESCRVAEGVDQKTARTLAAALNGGDSFACVRSAGLPSGVEPFAVWAGWCLPPEEIVTAKGKPVPASKTGTTE
jgi:hypothetical protein